LEQLESVFNSRVVPFSQTLGSFNAIVMMSLQNDVKALFDVDSKSLDYAVEWFEKTNDIPEELRKTIVETIRNLIDYDSMFSKLVLNKGDDLDRVVSPADVSKLVEAVSKCSLSLACTFALVREHKIELPKLKWLMDTSHQASEELLSFVDTVEILANPKELEKIANSLKHYNEAAK
jgi:hypothetical protein